MKKLPSPVESISTLIAKTEAEQEVDRLLAKEQELNEIISILQPLLYKLSTIIYVNDEPVSLHKLIEDSLNMLDKLNISPKGE